MHYMSEAQPLSFRWPKEFVDRIDAERGDVSRSLWVRKAVERALDESSGGQPVPESRPSPAPAEQPKKRKATQSPPKDLPEPPAASQKPTEALPNRGLTAEEARRYRQSVPGPNVENIRSSSQVKDFKPYPKGGKRS